MCPKRGLWFNLTVLALVIVLIVAILAACGGGKKEGQLLTLSSIANHKCGRQMDV
jgi:hypothetical protein